MTAPTTTAGTTRADEQAAPLDALLADAALGPLRRWLPDSSAAALAGHLAARPRAVVRRTGTLASELGRVATGRSTLEPARKDRRFTDPAWSGNPLLHRVLQTYLATGRAVHGLVEDAELDWRDDQRIRFLAENAVQALSPSNSPVLNPAAVKEALDTGGRSYLRGIASFARDMRTAPRIPSMVDTSGFAVGENLAVSPGAVVLRTPVFELIQYAPTTRRVREVPLLIAPPTINKYYIADLAPGRSMVEHFVGSGQQVFMMSWRNPGAEHADWGLDTYVRAVLDALDAVERICAVDRSVLMGLCSGGIVSALTLGHLAATGQGARVAAAVLGVTVLDQSRAGVTAAALDRRTADAAAASSARRGYLDGRALAEVFAWLRPGDLVWNYVANNYLLGRKPPAFDVLFWNADTARVAARLHRDFLDLGLDNALATPGAATALGVPVDLGAVSCDTYVVAGVTDHICPWQSCYRSARLFGGASRFVLSTSGHIAALVNPPTNPKASFWVSDTGPDIDSAPDWQAGARTEQGSWWVDFTAWLGPRSGRTRVARKALGGGGLEPICPAPGTYVLQT